MEFCVYYYSFHKLQQYFRTIRFYINKYRNKRYIGVLV